MIYYKMSLSLIIGWKNFYETGTVLETSVNKAFLQLDTDHVGKVNDLDNEVKDTKEEVKETQEDVDDIKGDITNINNVLVNIQNAQVEVNNTMANNRHNPRFTGTMVMDGDMQIGGTLLQGWPVNTITTPFYSNNNEYTINGVNDVFTDSNIPVPTYSRSFELVFKNNNTVNNNYGLLTSGFSSIGTNDANFNYFYFDMTNDNIVMYNGTNGANGIATISYDISSLFDNNYHHFIATISTVSRILTIYIDGQSIGTYTFASDNMIDCDSNGVRIGASIVDINNDIFNGSIKNIHIHNKYLSQEEVTIRYNLFNE